MIDNFAEFSARDLIGHRLINAKFPPIALFDDVSDADAFEDLYALQALTNPRLQTEIGNLSLVSLNEIPFGIRGCHYAAASFTHVNPDGSRFSDGSYGVMYIGNSTETAIAEVKHHQNNYWSNVPTLHYDRFVFKSLVCRFNVTQGLDATVLNEGNSIYLPNDYSYSRQVGLSIKKNGRVPALKYKSVRNKGGSCYALFTPQEITEVIPAKHYEMIWNGKSVTSVNLISKVNQP